MQPVNGLCPGARDHAQTAVRAHGVPVAVAFFLVQFPFSDAIERHLVARGNGADRTAFRADFAGFAEGLDADVNRFVVSQRHVCGDHGQTQAQPEFSGDEITSTGKLAQTAVNGSWTSGAPELNNLAYGCIAPVEWRPRRRSRTLWLSPIGPENRAHSGLDCNPSGTPSQ